MENQWNMSDAQLVERYRKGDGIAFEILVHRYKIPLYTFIYRFLGNHAMTDDVFQDVFVKVLKGLPRYQERGKFSNWLFSIANNLCLDHLRKQRRQNECFVSNTHSEEIDGLETITDSHFSLENVIEKKELKEILDEAIESLPVPQKQVLLLRQHTDLSFKEIADLLDCPLNTVLGRMRYALLNLRKALNQKFDGDHFHAL